MRIMGDPTTPLLSGADILVQCLLRHGVEVVFAYPGGASMPIHQALTHVSDRLRTILPRHEQGGGFAAEGYARSTGKAGVCVATSGPGATNFVTCLADAKMDSDAARRHHRPGRHARHRQRRLPGNAHRRNLPGRHQAPLPGACAPRTSPRVIKEAFHIATTGRPGPVLVDVPKDVQQRTVAVADWDPPMNLPGYSPYRRADRAELQRVLEAVRQSRKPIIYAGGGIIACGGRPATSRPSPSAPASPSP